MNAQWKEILLKVVEGEENHGCILTKDDCWVLLQECFHDAEEAQGRNTPPPEYVGWGYTVSTPSADDPSTDVEGTEEDLEAALNLDFTVVRDREHQRQCDAADVVLRRFYAGEITIAQYIEAINNL